MAKKKAPPKEDTSNKPWVSNYQPLQAWLRKIEARCQWQYPVGEPPTDPDERYAWTPNAFVECWGVTGKRDGQSQYRQFILVVHANRHGWEIFVDSGELRVDTTLADAEQRLGIVSLPSA